MVRLLADLPGDRHLGGALTASARAAALLTAVVSCGGCLDAASTSDIAWTSEVRDSAGVVIVENRPGSAQGGGDPSAAEDGAMRVRELAVVGGTDDIGGPGFGLVADAALAGDTLFVLDATAARISVWEPGGGHLRDIGGPGDGPGELSRFASSLLLLGDTLLVVDWGRGRVHRFLTDGTFLDAPLTTALPGRSWWQRGADGLLYARTLSRYVDDDARWRGRGVLLQVSLDAGSAEVGVQDTAFVFEYEETDVGGPGRPVLPLLVNAPVWEVLPGGRLAWATLDGEELRIHDAEGALRTIVRSGAWRRRPPTAEEEASLSTLLGDKLVSLGGSRETVEDLGPVMPALLPAVTSVRAGPGGTVWVQTLGSAGDVHPHALNTPDPPRGWGGSEWHVLDADGRWIDAVELGPRVSVARITDERIVGVRRDELGREEVVVWELVSPAGTATPSS